MGLVPGNLASSVGALTKWNRRTKVLSKDKVAMTKVPDLQRLPLHSMIRLVVSFIQVKSRTFRAEEVTKRTLGILQRHIRRRAVLG